MSLYLCIILYISMYICIYVYVHIYADTAWLCFTGPIFVHSPLYLLCSLNINYISSYKYIINFHNVRSQEFSHASSRSIGISKVKGHLNYDTMVNFGWYWYYSFILIISEKLFSYSLFNLFLVCKELFIRLNYLNLYVY